MTQIKDIAVVRDTLDGSELFEGQTAAGGPGSSFQSSLAAIKQYAHSWPLTALSASDSITPSILGAAYDNSAASASITASLQTATVGQKYLFINAHKFYDFNVDCTYSNRFREWPNGVQVTILKDSWIEVECRETNVWDIIASGGTYKQGYYPSVIPTIGTGAGRTIYLNHARPDDTGNGESLGAAKRTLRGIMRIARPGDYVIVSAGTYPDIPENEWVFANLPRGNQDNPIHFKCETAFGARFTKLAITAHGGSSWDLPRNDLHIDCTNLVWWANQEKSVSAKNTRFFRCGFVGGSLTADSNEHCVVVGGGGASPADVRLNRVRWASRVLFEDCVMLGKGGRSRILAYNAEKVIFRRCITRWDRGWTTSTTIQCSDGGLYDSSECEMQNCMSLDSLAPEPSDGAANYKGAFYLENNYADASNLAMRGCLVINNQGGPAYTTNALRFQPVTTPSSGTRTPGTPPWTFDYRRMLPKNWLIENCVGANVLNPAAYSSNVGMYILSKTEVRNCTIAGLNRQGYCYYTDPDPRSPAGSEFRNNVAVRVAGSSTGFDIASHSLGHNNLDYADMTAANTAGLYHPQYADIGSTIQTAGAGAYVLKRIGAPNSFYGDPNFRQIGDDGGSTYGDLWPWPYEADIKTFMREVDDAESRSYRGFTASGGTLTEYVFGILGTTGPLPPA